jgi:ribosomal-protein-alanine N-acetyltransferase
MTPRGPIELTTERLRLRPVAAADVDALHALWTDPQVRRFLWDDVVIDRETAARCVADSEASFAAAGWGLWAIEPRAGGALLGAAGLVELDPAVGPELNYALHPARQGNGYANEAARAVLDHAFGPLGFARVPGRTDAPNRASARVLERLGMRFEGEAPGPAHPQLCYALARDEWRRAGAGER